MSNSYKKFLDKAKQQKDSVEMSAKERMEKEKSLLKKYASGGQVKPSQQQEYQAKEYFGKDDGSSAGPESRMAEGGKVGSGKRFADLKEKLSHQKGVTDPGALAASIGREKYGNAKMEAMAHKHMSNGGPVDLKVSSMSESPSYYSEGGKVEHNKKNLEDLKAAFIKFLGEEAKEKYSEGGKVKDNQNILAPTGNPDMDKAMVKANAQPDHGGSMTLGIPNYDDGSKGVSNDDTENNKEVDPSIANYFRKMFKTPDPTPTPAPSLEDKYKAIRERNRTNMSGETSAAYFTGTPNVGGSANTANSLSPLLKNTYASHRKYSEGSLDVGPQTDEEKSIESGELARRAAAEIVKAKIARNPENYVEYNNPDKFPGVARPAHPAQMNNPNKFADGTPAVPPAPTSDMQESMRKAFKFSDGTDNTPPPPTSDAQESMRKAFHFNQGTPSNPNDLYNSYMRLFNGAVKVPTIPNPLAEVHAPAQKKINLNPPKPGHLKTPKRLGSVEGYKAYADGSDNVGMGDVQKADSAGRSLPIMTQGYGSPENDQIAQGMDKTNRMFGMNPGQNPSSVQRIADASQAGLNIGGIKNIDNELSLGLKKLYSLPEGEAKQRLSEKMMEALSAHGENGKDFVQVRDPNNPNRILHMSTEDGMLQDYIPSKSVHKYADGTSDAQDYDQEQNNPDLSPEEIASRAQELAAIKAKGDKSIPVREFDPEQIEGKQENPYPGEEEEAQKVTDDSLPGELEKDVEESEDKKPSKKAKKEDERNLEGMTLDKDEAKDEDDEDKDLEDKYKSEDDDAKLAASLDDKDDLKADEESKEPQKPREPASESEEEMPEPMKQQAQPNPAQELRDAQAQQRNAILFNQLGKATDKMGASMGHFKAQNQDIYDTNIANADLPVKQLEQRIQMEQFDPNSDTSKAMKAYLVKFGGPDALPKGVNITAANAEKFLPLIFKDKEQQQAAAATLAKIKEEGITKITAGREKNETNLQRTKETNDTKKQMAQEHNELMAALGKDKAEQAKQAKADKLDAKDVDRVDKFNKAINSEMANGRSAFGIAAKNKQAVENARALLNGETDFNNLDNRQVVETARVLDRVLSGGNSTISGSEHLTPESARSWLAKKLEFITNKRQGAGAGSFIKTMAGTLDREGQQADKQILKAQKEFMGPYKGLEKNDKDSRSYQNYINTLKSNHLDALLPKDEQEAGAEQPASVAAPNPAAPAPLAPNEVKRLTKDGKTAIFDGATKKFLRYE